MYKLYNIIYIISRVIIVFVTRVSCVTLVNIATIALKGFHMSKLSEHNPTNRRLKMVALKVLTCYSGYYFRIVMS